MILEKVDDLRAVAVVVRVLEHASASAGARERHGQNLPDALAPLPAALSRRTVVCRGPKPSAALKRYGVAVDVSVPEPYTTTELLQVLAPIELKDVEVTLVHYGERNDAFAEALRAREELIAGRFDAIVFTSQIQFRHLLQSRRVGAWLPSSSEL